MKSLYAPICLFVFNRLDHTQKTIEHLVKNAEAEASDLIIFSDGSRNSQEEEKVGNVRSYIRGIQGFKSIRVVERNKNWGLANSIIDGVTQIVGEYGRVIVLEDDIITAPYFLKYMNDALEVYKDHPKVASIHAYVYPTQGLPETFFLKGADCWGWATWENKWSFFEPDGKKLLQKLVDQKQLSQFNFDDTYPYVKMLRDQIEGKNNSWAIRWYASAFVNSLYTLYPGQSLVANIGFDSSGTHCDSTDQFDVTMIQRPVVIKPISVDHNSIAHLEFKKYFVGTKISLAQKVINKLFKKKS